MASFSERMGIVSVRETLQTDAMDGALRNSLWNAFAATYWTDAMEFTRLSKSTNLRLLCFALWRRYYKVPTDGLDSSTWGQVRNTLYESYSKSSWNGVYDFIEFIATNGPNPHMNIRFIMECTQALQREGSGYRFVDTTIAPLTSEQEIAAIEQALAAAEASKPLNRAGEHFRRALELLADRQAPDFRNSMKESISAVEAVCKLIADDSSTTLGRALDMIEQQRKITLHRSLKKAFQALYGYTNDAEGIRHAMKDEPNLELEDATYMLVTCSAFVNYLVEKARKAGISL